MDDSLGHVRIQRSLLLFAVLALGDIIACGTAPHLRVDADVLDKITIENKLRLFDAENELNIAIDARDQVIDEIAQIKDDVRRADKKREVAQRDVEVFESKGDGERVRLSELRRAAATARIEYLDARLEWARGRLDRQRRQLIVAKARFELAKARLVKKNNVPGASDIDLEDFEEQVKDYRAEVGETDEDIKEAEIEMKAREENWIAQSKTLQEATGGALGSRWLD
ncbi:MAG: hypothetical protein AAFV29_04195 [Myxococcota bacterium]